MKKLATTLLLLAFCPEAYAAGNPTIVNKTITITSSDEQNATLKCPVGSYITSFVCNYTDGFGSQEAQLIDSRTGNCTFYAAVDDFFDDTDQDEDATPPVTSATARAQALCVRK